MKLPKQAAPVKRPSLIQPHTTVDVIHGNQNELRCIRFALLNGANFNDPAPFEATVYSWGCQLPDRNIGVSADSMAMCIDSWGM